MDAMVAVIVFTVVAVAAAGGERTVWWAAPAGPDSFFLPFFCAPACSRIYKNPPPLISTDEGRPFFEQ